MAEFVLHQGRVMSPEGHGVPFALVAVARGTAPTPEVGIRCDESGKFQIALPPGRYVIEARALDGRAGSIEISTGGLPGAIEIVL